MIILNFLFTENY